ncbi:hypothetical protein [Agrococcus sp. KRD186]|jgi:hypothetical protein|uniref:hypothetical protein n=1 Tax=Agrococcus sp. KRD186 TaxID=2729730 RepID=UPI0019D04B8A|nr:hypothetical protein [Agrococcus sp. KRD186]
MSDQPASVDVYIAGFPPDVAERLQQVRAAIVAQVPARDAHGPEERMRSRPRSGRCARARTP